MSARPTILLVDDEPHVVHGLAAVLRKEPYDVVLATSAAEALALLEQRPADVIISDEQMPGMRGWQLLAAVRAKHPETMRIVLSGQATVEATINSINAAQVFCYLTKPCTPETLKATVADALKLKAQRRLESRIVESVREQAHMVMAAAALDAPAGDGAPIPAHPSGGFSEHQLRDLSIREREVLDHIGQGRRVSQIAKTLFISDHTVRNHLKAIFRKLDVHSQGEIIRRVRR
jgi:DNA-binding NarL/FixJ family response regulator